MLYLCHIYTSLAAPIHNANRWNLKIEAENVL